MYTPRRCWAGPLAAVAVLTTATPAAHARCGNPVERPWCNAAQTPERRAELLLEAMTLAQKVQLMAGDDPLGVVNGDPATGTVNGIAELGIPPLYMSDGPVGPREGQATAFPSPLALAASFNPALAFDVGATIANEVRHKGNDLVHAPTVDVMRIPQAGRTFETYGEDPHLASRIAPQWVLGVKSEGVIPNVKHYALNTQEGQIGLPPITAALGGRQLVNAIVDERTLRELHLLPFETAVKEADPGTLMCSYNLVNGEPACGNARLLQTILRDEWGFDGFVLTDYYAAVKDTAASVNAGLEIEMPVPLFYTPLQLQLVSLTGLVAADAIDQRVSNILRTLFRFGFFDRDAFASDESRIDQTAHAAVARRNIEEGLVLLQNNGVLPLDAAALDSIAIIGSVAETYVNGGGSSAVEPYVFNAPRSGIEQRFGKPVSYHDGSNAAAAAAVAAEADVALVFVRDNATEGVDKNCLSLDCGALPGLPGSGAQDALIESVAAANPRTVVLLHTGGPVLTPWRSRVAAVVAAWYPGQEAGPGMARVLFGDTDVSGRLPVSFMAAEADTPVAGNPLQYPGIANQTVFSEGLFTGYRWHDANDIAPAYPFGHGLSYTQFRYTALSLRPLTEGAELSFTVQNTGTRSGIAVPQVYVGLPATEAVPQPVRQLRHFTRVALAPGEAQRLTVVLGPRALQYWSTADERWAVPPGCALLSVGASSRNLPLTATLPLAGADCPGAPAAPVGPGSGLTASNAGRFGGSGSPALLLGLAGLWAVRRYGRPAQS